MVFIHPAVSNYGVFQLRYKGVFDFDVISTFIIGWFKDRMFDVQESNHKHKMSCPHGFEIEWAIDAWRKIDGYYQHRIKVVIKMFDAFQVDATKDGKKVKLWNARIDISMGCAVECDYQNKYESTPFMRKLHKFFVMQIIKKDVIFRHGDPLYYKTLELYTAVKKNIGMGTAVKW